MSEKAAPAPSPSDINFMIQIFQHMTEKPVIDWDSFANAAGFKSASVAQTRWGQIRRKLSHPVGQATPKKSTAQGSSTTPGSASKVKKTAGRVGAKAKGKNAVKMEEDADEEGDEDEETETPSKAARVKLEDAAI
ncbi:uncharacterized protein ColSpa_07166 [Colletotrichum spaethianum]|uniref:Myb-like DNA-binding domain-containing protein n=1 Tax=Colletotrichum spaethianum TaxID=700344 RepID=A0AA37P1M9_9PEZI|nr:uncharacterized protein ColSpa_07166 [Colletotrichum spaethianum]GKT46985.1 hypothetical protein ColSpa_07166 [Colletotrichum spaethianum]